MKAAYVKPMMAVLDFDLEMTVNIMSVPVDNKPNNGVVGDSKDREQDEWMMEEGSDNSYGSLW